MTKTANILLVWPNWIRRLTSNQKIAGSSPVMSLPQLWGSYPPIAQLAEHPTVVVIGIGLSPVRIRVGGLFFIFIVYP